MVVSGITVSWIDNSEGGIYLVIIATLVIRVVLYLVSVLIKDDRKLTADVALVVDIHEGVWPIIDCQSKGGHVIRVDDAVHEPKCLADQYKAGKLLLNSPASQLPSRHYDGYSPRRVPDSSKHSCRHRVP